MALPRPRWPCRPKSSAWVKSQHGQGSVLTFSTVLKFIMARLAFEAMADLLTSEQLVTNFMLNPSGVWHGLPEVHRSRLDSMQLIADRGVSLPFCACCGGAAASSRCVC